MCDDAMRLKAFVDTIKHSNRCWTLRQLSSRWLDPDLQNRELAIIGGRVASALERSAACEAMVNKSLKKAKQASIALRGRIFRTTAMNQTVHRLQPAEKKTGLVLQLLMWMGEPLKSCPAFVALPGRKDRPGRKRFDDAQVAEVSQGIA